MSTKRIVYADQDANLIVLIPSGNCGLTLEQIAEKDVPAGTKYRVVDESEVPLDRTFRNAWVLKGSEIDVDMPKAKELHKNHLRSLRKPILEALDVEFVRSLEKGDSAKQKEITDKKQALRDITAHPLLDAAQTPDELKAITLP